MSKEKFETSKREGVHKEFESYTGNWKGVNQMMFKEGEVTDESPITGTIQLILGGRFLLHEYKGSYGGEPFEGIAIYGYHIDKQRYESAWVESFGMGSGILFSQSPPGAQEWSFTGHYGGETPETSWGWKTSLEKDGDNKLIIFSQNLRPNGEKAGGVRILYERIS
ncbi:PF07617 domain protein [Leptospira weilii serovar Topaz str. LT2116]|uniref:PF07617 domain protein n=1 Tax=Leptospira weilii serovar Topaz str. LT2116 TaxID=1088540 RepID=M3FT70_9LEPT|nr:PF07617 domain protein [Leptospira weilii serovar Topaz str. LT2116]